MGLAILIYVSANANGEGNMPLRILVLCIMSTVFLCCNASSAATKHAPKKWTITDRQVELRKRVENGLRANELNNKEAKQINGRLDQLDKDIEKMKSKNGGKLSYKDEGKVEKRLNSISLEMEGKELAKRVTAK